MRNLLKSAVIVALAVALTLLVVSVLPNAAGQVQPVRADGMGGLLNASVYPPLLDGTRRYTTALTYSAQVDVSNFGSVQIMLNGVVTGSQTITLTPQFSLQNVNCVSARQWFSGTTTLYYQPTTTVSDAELVTETVGAWQATPVIDHLVLNGTGTVGRELSIQGQCMRVQLQFSNSGQHYTPTVVIRALDRN